MTTSRLHLSRLLASLLGVLGVVASIGCDPMPGPDDGGEADSGAVADCAGVADGTPCGDDRICNRNLCERSECGDGIRDGRTEDCDDGNTTAFDGCEESCEYTCATDADCADGDPCNGVNTCDTSTHSCAPGESAEDGTACDDPEDGICLDGGCVTTSCGDGYVDGDAGEECEDQNAVEGDGCDNDCRRTCEMDDVGRCTDDGEACNGDPVCESDFTCGTSAPLADGAFCAAPGSGATGTCQAGTCIPEGCGNGIIDSGEDCDDMNADDTDGCTVACEFTCTSENEAMRCGDGDVCNGVETCDVTSHTCQTGSALACDDGNACTADSCDPVAGCLNPLIDMDGDGEAPTTLGACGTDCDDSMATTCSGCSEICMDGLDNDCNGTADDGLTTWYADCDGDGYAPGGTATVMDCTAPPASTTGCSGGARQWITRAPTGGNVDCNDGNASVRPGATEIVGNERDDNCDGVELCYRNSDGDSHRVSSTRTSSDSDCRDPGEARASLPSGDCNDGDSSIYPSAPETCDRRDEDCDSTVDEGAPRTPADGEEPNDLWSHSAALQTSGPSLPGGGSASTGSSSVVSPPGTLSFHTGDSYDHYIWDRAYSLWNPSYQPYWMCRVTGLAAGQTVNMRVGVHRPGGDFNASLCGAPANVACFNEGTTFCPGVGDGGICRSARILTPSAGGDDYGFGVQLWPGSGWAGCDNDYDVECKLTEAASW